MRKRSSSGKFFRELRVLIRVHRRLIYYRHILVVMRGERKTMTDFLRGAMQ